MQSWRFYQAYGALEFRITNLSDAEIAVVRSYITALSALELAVTAAADNLDTDEAAVWVRNKTEIVDRITVFDEWRRRLCGFLGVPPGPALHGRGAALVV